MKQEFNTQLEMMLNPELIKYQEPMKNHTTFRIGGPADYYVTPGSVEQLAATIKLCQKYETPYYVLGNGSNLLVSDEGYRGVIISIGEPWNYCRIEGLHLIAGAGILLSRLSKYALEHSLQGMEFAAGIPGTVGGAVVMNAGAYGSEIKNVLESVRVLTEDGQVLKLSREELQLGYRYSMIPEKNYIVLEAVFTLLDGNPLEIKEQMEDMAAKRRSRQPLEYPSAGSTFKRPEGYFAGKLIQDAGMRGFRVGDAQVSEKHCGFVINRGEATASDVMKLCRTVQEKVRTESGVDLELEVKTLGTCH